MSKLKKWITLGAAAAAGAFVGSKYTESKMEKEMEEAKKNAYQYSYAPSIIEGSTLQEWERAKGEYAAKYGSKVVSLALKHNKHLESMLDQLSSQRKEWENMLPAALFYDEALIKSALYPTGNQVKNTGKLLIPFIFVDSARFNPDRDLGTSYLLKRAVRTSLFLPSHYARDLEVDRRAATVEYLVACNDLIQREMESLMKDLSSMKELGEPSLSTREMVTEKFYQEMVISFPIDVRYLD